MFVISHKRVKLQQNQCIQSELSKLCLTFKELVVFSLHTAYSVQNNQRCKTHKETVTLSFITDQEEILLTDSYLRFNVERQKVV